MKKFILISVVVAIMGCDDSSKSDNNTNNNNQVLTQQDIIRACLIKDACDVLTGGYVAPCVKSYYEEAPMRGIKEVWDELYRCTLEAGSDCNAVKMCFGNNELPQSCDYNQSKGSCYGNIRYYCESFSSTQYAMDCSASGQVCIIGNDGSPQCSAGPCDEETFEGGCQDNRIQVCQNGYINTTDCSVLGLTCQRFELEGGDFMIGCYGTGGQCDPETFEPFCDSETKVTCELGITTEIDCTSLPGEKKCELVGGTPWCNPAGTECTEGQETCLDSFRASICIDGHLYEEDCSELGFTRCTGIGANHDIGAHCTH